MQQPPTLDACPTIVAAVAALDRELRMRDDQLGRQRPDPAQQCPGAAGPDQHQVALGQQLRDQLVVAGGDACSAASTASPLDRSQRAARRWVSATAPGSPAFSCSSANSANSEWTRYQPPRSIRTMKTLDARARPASTPSPSARTRRRTAPP